MSMPSVLRVHDLCVEFRTRRGVRRAVDGVSFELSAGGTLGLVGESGSGKTLTAMALLGLLPAAPHCVVLGQIEIDGRRLPVDALRGDTTHRGRRIAMIFQEPMTALNPVRTIRSQMIEVLCRFGDVTPDRAAERALDLLDTVGIGKPRQCLQHYPHQLSGGMRQRVMIAMALSCEPDVLVADEPTTALDVTTQAQVLDLIAGLQKQRGMAVVMISHNLSVVAQICRDVLIMQAGRVVERAQTRALFSNPQHAYTRRLLAAIPRLDRPARAVGPTSLAAGSVSPALEVSDLVVRYPRRRQIFERSVPDNTAVGGVSLRIGQGRALGLVGPSGCGKSSLGRALLRLHEPSAGQVRVAGQDITAMAPAQLRRARASMQMIFQDPYASLSPRRTVGQTLAEPLNAFGLGSPAERKARILDLLDTVGLGPDVLPRYPHEFSGGQRQRIAITRALVLEPPLIVADEAVSALDVSIQADVLELLITLQARYGMAMLFISHDLAVIRQICHDVAVMEAGLIVEHGTVDDVFGRPQHSLTRALLAAVPRPPGSDSRASTGHHHG
ncbi:MAG: ABC transporter ATP-binding protein [Pseudomonadota bacterium]